MKEESFNTLLEAEAQAQFGPLLLPKVQLPRIQKSLLRRERLLQELDKSLDYRLTVIAGPAGYGKTTAVTQWIAERSARRDFPRVAYIVLDEGDNDPIRFWRYVIAACQKLQPDFGRQALAWLPSENRSWRTIALSVVGFGEIFDGNLKNARDCLLEAVILNEQQGNLVHARASRGMLSWVSAEQGELHHAAEQFRQMQAEARAQKDYDDIAHSQLALAQIAYQWNKLEEARQDAQEALEIGERMEMEEFLALSTMRLALIEYAQCQGSQARQRLLAWLAGRPTPVTPHSYHLYREVQAALARLYLADGDLLSVERWFENVERRDEPLPLLQRQREQVLKARLLLARGESDAVIEQLERLSMAAQQTGHFTLQREAQVVLALASFQQGERQKGQRQLLELLRATCSENYQRLYLDQGEEMVEHLRDLLPQISEKTMQIYARRLLNAFDRRAGAPAVQVQPVEGIPMEPLSAQERKVLRLLAAGNSNAEIARELVVSVNTIRTQVQSIYRKLNVNNRVEASEAARRSGLV